MFEGLFSPMHWVVILVIVLILFGPGKLPELGSSLGKAIREFKSAAASAERPSLPDIQKIEAKTNVPAEPAATKSNGTTSETKG